DTSQLLMSWLKLLAPWNMTPIEVTFAMSQLPISPLNCVAPANSRDISSTADTSQWLKSVSSVVQFSNMLTMDVTPLRLGASEALTCRFEQPKNALCMDVQPVEPH